MTREFPKNKTPEITLPTVGRIVLYHTPEGPKPYPAMVVEVVGGSLTIYTAHAFLPDGLRIVSNLKHITDIGAHEEGWDWMDYQKGQAAKTDQLESALHKALAGAQGGQQTGLRASPHDLETGKQQASAPSPVDGKR